MHHDDNSLSPIFETGRAGRGVRPRTGRVGLYVSFFEMIRWWQMKVNAEKATQWQNIGGRVSSSAVWLPEFSSLWSVKRYIMLDGNPLEILLANKY